MRALLSKIPAPLHGKEVVREENCRVCNASTGTQIAEVDYWDIKTSKLVKCNACNHIQLDPMLNDAETAKGCFAYYIEESLRVSHKEIFRNCVRNFRRGVVFGYSLKNRGITPNKVLELGPGSGYFCVGLQFVFPDIEVTVLDINEEILQANQKNHNYKPILEVPDNFVPACAGKFDLVIARDIIEHVSNVSSVIHNVNQYLKIGGHFHFITPNGHEDVWKHYLTSQLTNSTSELLINHVNYFDGKSLKDLLHHKGFNPVEYYTYQIKTTWRGKGWKKNLKLMSPASTKYNADKLIKEKATEIANYTVEKKQVLDQWYIKPEAKWVTLLYSKYQQSSLIKIDPELNIGHEIYGLFKKTKPVNKGIGISFREGNRYYAGTSVL